MKKYKPKVKDFHEQALIILVEQKQDEKFTKYVKKVLKERYLSDDVTLHDLSKKIHLSKNGFQKDILWESISTKLLIEKDDSQIIRAYYLMEEMPIDNLVQLTQYAENTKIREQAKKICHQKERQLEEELGLDMIDFEKYEQDEQEFFENTKDSIREKARISKKRQFDLSITTRKFIQDFFGILCIQDEKLSHEVMEKIIYEKGLKIPNRGRIQNISYEQVVTGSYILVRNETNKSKNARIIPYVNPYGDALENLSKEMGIPYQKR